MVDLNVIFNSELKRLNGVGNNIIGIDLSSNNKLNYLNLEANPLTSIDLSNNLILDSIILKSTELKKLDLGVNQELVYLDCSSSDLHLLNVLNGNNQNIFLMLPIIKTYFVSTWIILHGVNQIGKILIIILIQEIVSFLISIYY